MEDEKKGRGGFVVVPISEEEGQETFLKSGKERFLPPFLRGCPLRKNLSKWKGGGGGERGEGRIFRLIHSPDGELKKGIWRFALRKLADYYGIPVK